MFCSLAGLAVPSAAHAAKGDNDKISLSNEPRRCSQGTQLSFWEDDQGTLWADLTETFDGFSKTYEGLVVVADPDVSLDLDKLNQLSETDQKRSVHVTLRKNLSEKNLLALENRFPEVEITGVVHLGKEGLKGGYGCIRCGAEVGLDRFCDSCTFFEVSAVKGSSNPDGTVTWQRWGRQTVYHPWATWGEPFTLPASRTPDVRGGVCTIF